MRLILIKKWFIQLLNKLRFLIISIILFFSCSSDKEESFLASYKDYNLTLEEALLNKPLSVDSADFFNRYIHSWLRHQAVLDKSKLYIDENDKELQLQVNKYKESLIIYRYEQELISNKFDTTVLRSEIEEYYVMVESKNFHFYNLSYFF